MARSRIQQQMQNERRKAQRRINSLNAAMKETKNREVKSVIRKEIKELQRAVNATKERASTGRLIKTHTTQAYKEKALRSLSEVNEKFSSYVHSMKAQNAITQTEINIASVGGKSSFSREDVKAFYHHTQRVWNAKNKDGSPKFGANNRNEAIMAHYGVRTLKEAFDIALTEAKQEAKVASGEVTEEDMEKAKKMLRNSSKYTSDELAWAWEVTRVNDVSMGITSPNSSDTSEGFRGIVPVGAR